MLERCFFKTLINIAHISPTIQSVCGSDPEDPPEWMLSLVFDGQAPMRPLGLYTAVNLDLSTDAAELSFSELRDDTHDLVAGLFGFRHFRFVVWLRDQVQANLMTAAPDWHGWTMLGPEPKGFNIDQPDGPHSQVLRYRW